MSRHTERAVLRINGSTEDGRSIERYVVLTGYLDGEEVAEWFDAPVGPTTRAPESGFVRVPQRRPFMGTEGRGPFRFGAARRIFEFYERNLAGLVVAEIQLEAERMRWGLEGTGRARCGSQWRPFQWRCIGREVRPASRPLPTPLPLHTR